MGRSGDKAMDKRVRMIAEITISDYQAAVDILTRAAKHIEDNLPGVLAWDIFIDKETGQMFMHEVFSDEEALLVYERSMTELGYREQLGRYAAINRTIGLGSVSDPHLAEELSQFGAVRV